VAAQSSSRRPPPAGLLSSHPQIQRTSANNKLMLRDTVLASSTSVGQRVTKAATYRRPTADQNIGANNRRQVVRPSRGPPIHCVGDRQASRRPPMRQAPTSVTTAAAASARASRGQLLLRLRSVQLLRIFTTRGERSTDISTLTRSLVATKTVRLYKTQERKLK